VLDAPHASDAHDADVAEVRIPGWVDTGDSGETGDTATGSGTTTDPTELTCDGAMDDGRAIKLCGLSAGQNFGGLGVVEDSDLSGDGIPDLLVLSPYTTLLDLSDMSTSQIVDYSDGVLLGPDSGHIFLSVFGQGGRDGDG